MSRPSPCAIALVIFSFGGCDCGDDDAFTALVPAIAVDVERLAFPDTFVGAQSSAVVRISSVGTASVRVQKAILSNDDDGAAFLGGEIELGSMLSGSDRVVSFVFLPTTPGAFTAHFVVDSDAANRSQLDVILSGEGLAPLDCDDDNACTDERFDPFAGVCIRGNNDDDCDDGSACTGSDRCAAGSCLGTALECADDVTCTSDLCDPTRGCVFVPDHEGCADDDPCTLDVCDPNGFLDGCTNPPAPDGTPCGEFEACTSIEVCVQRFCTSLPIPDGAPCSDGDICTAGDVCGGGACVGTATQLPPAVVRESFRFLGAPRGVLLGSTLLWPDQFLRSLHLDVEDSGFPRQTDYAPSAIINLARPAAVTRIDDERGAVLERSSVAGRADDAAFVHIVDRFLNVERSIAVSPGFRLLGADATHIHGCNMTTSNAGDLVSLLIEPDPEGDEAPPVQDDRACRDRVSPDGAGVFVVRNELSRHVEILEVRAGGSVLTAEVLGFPISPQQVFVGRRRVVLLDSFGPTLVNVDRPLGERVSALVMPPELLLPTPVAVAVDKLYVVTSGDVDCDALCDTAEDSECDPCPGLAEGYRRLSFDDDDGLTLDDWRLDTPLRFIDGQSSGSVVAVSDVDAVVSLADGSLVVADNQARVTPISGAGAIDALLRGSDADPTALAVSVNQIVPVPAAFVSALGLVDTPGFPLRPLCGPAPSPSCFLRGAHLFEDRGGQRSLYTPRGPALSIDSQAHVGVLPAGLRSDPTEAVNINRGLSDVMIVDDDGVATPGIGLSTVAAVAFPTGVTSFTSISLDSCIGAALGARDSLAYIYGLSACVTVEDPHADALSEIRVPELDEAVLQQTAVSSWQSGTRVSFLAEGVAVLVDVENPLAVAVLAVVHDDRLRDAEFLSAGSDLDAWVITATDVESGPHLFVYDVAAPSRPFEQLSIDLPSSSSSSPVQIAHRVLAVAWPRAFINVWDGTDDVARGHAVLTLDLAVDPPALLERIPLASEPVDLLIVNDSVVVARADGLTVISPPCGP